MTDLSLFTYCEAVELILGFYSFSSGFWEDEINKIPEARRFVDMGLTQADKDHADLQVLNKQGEELLHEYIKFISENFIKHMKERGFESDCKEILKWFYQEYSLKSEDDAKEIANYICDNLYHYGYKVNKSYSRRKGEFYRLVKCS